MNSAFWRNMQRMEEQMIKKSTKNLTDDTAKKDDTYVAPVANNNVIRVYHF